MKTALYPGTFDPLTFGHIDLFRRASALFDHVTVAIAKNPRKTPLFSVNERLEILARHTREFENVAVTSFDGLVVEFAKKNDFCVLLRGLRTASDFEFEYQMALTNRELEPTIESVFMMPSPEYTYLSSSLIKEVVSNGGDASRWLPQDVYLRVVERM
jgi:pantetheine-phosphate adenylyltransferase